MKKSKQKIYQHPKWCKYRHTMCDYMYRIKGEIVCSMFKSRYKTSDKKIPKPQECFWSTNEKENTK